jgi:hypothetical protein
LVDDEVAFAAFSFLFHLVYATSAVRPMGRFPDFSCSDSVRADYLCCEQYVLVTWVVLLAPFSGLFHVTFPILELFLNTKPTLTHADSGITS